MGFEMSSFVNEQKTSCLLSVIIPVYNGAAFLRQCLDSVLSQTFSDYELICVNDGSTDATLEIMKEYENIDNRMSILNQDNLGVSAARNRGLECAKGSYVIFLDGDDWFETTMFEKMLTRMEGDHADICVCSGWRYDMRFHERILGKSYLRSDYIPARVPFSITDVGKYLFNFTTFHIYKMYRCEMLNRGNIKFRPYSISEDAIFYTEALLNANLITVVNEPLFNYRVNSGVSASSRVTSSILSGYQSLLEIQHLLQEKKLYCGDIKQSFINKALASTFHYGRQAITADSFFLWFNQMKEKGGLEALDIIGKSADYFYNENDYKKLLELLSTEDPIELLFNYYRQTIQARDQAKSKVRKLSKRITKITNSKSYCLATKISGIMHYFKSKQ